MTDTTLGHRGLQMEQATLFEQDNPGKCGVDLPDADLGNDRLGGLEVPEPRQAGALQDPADRGRRHANLLGDVPAGPTPPA